MHSMPGVRVSGVLLPAPSAAQAGLPMCDSDRLMWVLLPLAMLCVLVFVSYASLASNSGAFAIIVNALQMLAVFARFSLAWPPVLVELFG